MSSLLIRYRLLCVLMLLAGISFSLRGQEIASEFFERVSERYESIEDYTANLVITKESNVQAAAVQYKKPNLLRLDFSIPEGMILVVDGEQLLIWVPLNRIVFAQPLRREEQEQVVSLAGSQGLKLMQRYYTIAYTESPTPTPIDPGSSEKVVKLHLEWKSGNEGFKELFLSIGQNLLIRRIRGITTQEESITLDFTDISLNQEIPESRFSYEPPPTGRTVENFLFDPGEQP